MPGPGPPSFSIAVSAAPGATVLAVEGELDLATTPELERALRSALAGGPVVLDLAAVSFMDSAGVRGLAAVVRDLTAEGWSLRVRPELQDAVRQILEMTGMMRALPFDPPAAHQPG